jgi:hypothetical protein
MSNPNTDIVILTALGNVLLANTRLATLQAAVSPTPMPFYVQQKFKMSQGMFPALHLSSGIQSYNRLSTNHYGGNLLAIVEYYDKWTSQAATNDAIRANIAADLEIMKSNAGKNEDLVFLNVSRSTSIPRMTLSPYRGEFDEETVPGQKLIYRTLELSISIPPYDEM